MTAITLASRTIARRLGSALTNMMAASPDYDALAAQAVALTADEPDVVANMANLSALLFQALPDVNWVGFYRLLGDELVLGPFQGKPACIRIALGQGVCGVAMATQSTQRVDDVHQFAGHIACDPASRSELVVPLVDANGRACGVLDIDSASLARFSPADAAGLERLCAKVLPRISDTCANPQL